jgi:carboxymethylenebutenolidase
MLSRNYLYTSGDSTNKPTGAVIVLPEIFGPTDSIKRVADRFAKEFGMLGVVLDHFYSVNGKSEAFDYQTGRETGVELMQQEKGADFLKLFNTAVSELMAEYSSLEEITVCGFCFGGRLSQM